MNKKLVAVGVGSILVALGSALGAWGSDQPVDWVGLANVIAPAVAAIFAARAPKA
jgi:hypothetical protein